MKNSKVYFLLLRIFLVIIVLSAVFYFVDLKETLKQIKSVPLSLYFFVVLGHFLIMMIKAKRWQILSRSQDIYFPYLDGLRAYFIGFTFATFTPGQLGDLGKVFFLNQKILSKKKIFSATLMDRLWDLISLTVITIFCIIFLIFEDLELHFLLTFIIAVVILGLLIVFFSFKPLNYLLSTKYDLDIRTFFQTNTISFILSISVILIQLFRWGALAYAIDLPILIASLTGMVGTFIALIPISIAGLGTREAFIIFIFNEKSLSVTSGLTFSLLMFGTYLIGALWGLVLLLTYKGTNYDVLKS
jgi:glycosyltransferase 2 family protein